MASGNVRLSSSLPPCRRGNNMTIRPKPREGISAMTVPVWARLDACESNCPEKKKIGWRILPQSARVRGHNTVDVEGYRPPQLTHDRDCKTTIIINSSRWVSKPNTSQSNTTHCARNTLLPGTMVNRNYGTDKNLYEYFSIFTTNINKNIWAYVFTMVPCNRSHQGRPYTTTRLRLCRQYGIPGESEHKIERRHCNS